MKIIFLFAIYLILNITLQKSITIHFIPHSHNDVGWLCTAEEYYDGCSKGNVSKIFNSVLDNIITDE